MVKKGDPIVKLSNSDLQLEFMNKEAQMLDQMNNMRNTRISLENNYLSLKQQLLEVENAYIEQKQSYDRNKAATLARKGWRYPAPVRMILKRSKMSNITW